MFLARLWAGFLTAGVASLGNAHTFTHVAIEGHRLRARQLDPFGNVADAFTIDKR